MTPQAPVRRTFRLLLIFEDDHGYCLYGANGNVLPQRGFGAYAPGPWTVSGAAQRTRFSPRGSEQIEDEMDAACHVRLLSEGEK